jgi:hypothetical protein
MTDTTSSPGTGAAPGDGQLRHNLLTRIQRRRRSIDAFLDRARPRRSRLTKITVISGAVSAALTAGPALGGTDFSGAVQDTLRLPYESLSWQALCIAATIFSLISAIVAGLMNSEDIAGRVTTAEVVNADLEGLETMLELNRMEVAAALNLYQQYLTKVPFVDEDLNPTDE